MATISSIAVEYDMQPYELAAFLDLSQGSNYEEELDGEDAQNIIDLLKYNQEHSH